MSGRRKQNNKQKENPAEQLIERFARWDFLYENGGSDPCWPDGVNLNLVSNHIRYYKQRIEEEYPDGSYPEIYSRPTPPEVDNNYMAKPDEIRMAARKSLEIYKADEDYRYILSHISLLGAKDQKRLCAGNVLGYVSHLEDCIQKDDLVYQRLHGNADRYLDSFKGCAKQIRELLSQKEQLPLLFSSAGAPQADDSDEDMDEEYQCEDEQISI